jgi:hypothetical protein
MSEGNAPFFIDREILVLTREGVWLADGTEITHEPTRRLFARSLVRDAEGYQLKIGRESKRVTVEDTAYFVLRIDGDPHAGYELLLSDETRERLDPKTLFYRPARLTARVKGGSEEAKFLHAPYFDLLRELEEDGDSFFLTISGARVRLAPKS